MKSLVDSRLTGSPGLGREELGLLRQSAVGIVGAGVIGGQLAYHLGLLGVRQTIIDHGTVNPENLGNQGFPWKSIGEAKSETRRRQIMALNPDCQVTAVVERIENLGFAALAGLTVIATGLDSRSSRVTVNERAYRLAVPWVDAAVDGSGRSLFGTVTVHDPRIPDSPCYMCRLTHSDLELITRIQKGTSCPNWRKPSETVTPPTLQASAFAAVVAGLQAWTITELLLGRAERLVGCQLLIEGGAKPRIRQVKLQRNRKCLFDHEPFSPLKKLSGRTPGDLMRAAIRDLGAEPETLEVPGLSLFTSLSCPACGRRRRLLRTAIGCGEEEIRCGCKPNSEMAPEGLTSSLRLRDLRAAMDCSWTELGFPESAIVSAFVGAKQTHYVVNSTTRTST